MEDGIDQVEAAQAGSGTERLGAVSAKVMSPQELSELKNSVRHDLHCLHSADLAHLGEAGLRDVSGRLRRLLVDERPTLQRLRKAMGLKGEPRITTPVFPDAVGVVFAQSAGAMRAGGQVMGVRLYGRALSEAEIKANYESWKQRPKERQWPLSNWLSSVCISVRGIAVTRRDVIKFVANKLGGIHFDPQRAPSRERGYMALDEVRSTLQVADLDAVYAELAAIAQQFVASPQVVALLPE